MNSTSAAVKCPGDCPWKRKADALLHLKSIASRIRAADADIIVLAEVQVCNVGSMLLHAIDDPTLRFYLIPGLPISFPPSLFFFFCIPRRKVKILFLLALLTLTIFCRDGYSHWPKCCVADAHRPVAPDVAQRSACSVPCAWVCVRLSQTARPKGWRES